VLFSYNGCRHNIKVRKSDNKYYFADGLKQFRKALNIHEGVTITTPEKDWIFNIHFMPPLDKQTCGRLPTTTRTHVWTIKLTQPMISAAYPLVRLYS